MIRRYEQQEFYGLNRSRNALTDPRFADRCVNLQPTGRTLEPIESRESYLGVDPPAFWCCHFGQYWLLKPDDPYGVDWSYSGDTFKVHVIFRVEKDLGLWSDEPMVFGCVNDTDTAWGFFLVSGTGTNPKLVFRLKDDTGSPKEEELKSSVAPGTWIKATVDVGNSTANWECNGDTGSFSVNRDTFTGSGWEVRIGYKCLAVSIAFAAVGNITLPNDIAEAYFDHASDVAYFMPFSARHSALDAGCGAWLCLPQDGVETVPAASWVAEGPDGRAAGGYRLFTPELGLYKRRFTIIFCYDGKGLLLSSRDSQLQLFSTSSSQISLKAIWPVVDTSNEGTVSVGRRGYFTGSAGKDLPGWVAFDFHPGNNDGGYNFQAYYWDIGMGSWVSIGTSSEKHGIADFDASEWIVAAGLKVHAILFLEDNPDWTSDVDPDHPKLIPGLKVWINANTSSQNLDNWRLAGPLEYKPEGDVLSIKAAVPNRVNGNAALLPLYWAHVRGGSACSVVKYSALSACEDLLQGNAGLEVATEWFYRRDDGVTIPTLCPVGGPQRKISSLGAYRVLHGSAPLHAVAGDVVHPFSVPISELVAAAYSGNETAGTTNYDGELDWSTAYSYVLTIYDPVTGDESLPHGPFHFETASDGGTATDSSYGPSGCSFRIDITARSQIDLEPYVIRVWRKSPTTGLYHLEGSCNLEASGVSSDYDCVEYSGTFYFRISDEDLLLQQTVEYDNDDPKPYRAVAVYGNRAFYVDVANPSRVYFSKRYRLGSVPPTNLIWTDEGAGGAILGFLPVRGGLLLLRERSLWLIPDFIEDGDAFALELVPDIGAASGASAVIAEGALVMLSPAGLYIFDQGTWAPQKLVEESDNVEGPQFEGVWRLVRCYYYPRRWEATFHAAGRGVAVDLRTLNVSLRSAPETCFAWFSGSSYVGPLWGSWGGVWKLGEKDENGIQKWSSLSFVSSTANMLFTTSGNVSAYSVTHTPRVGVTADFPGWISKTVTLDTVGTWAAEDSMVGITLGMAKTTYDCVVELPMQMTAFSTSSRVYLGPNPIISDVHKIWAHNLVTYWRSQWIHMGSWREAFKLERAEFYFGPGHDSSTPWQMLATVQAGFWDGHSTQEATLQAGYSTPSWILIEMPLRIWGNRFRWIYSNELRKHAPPLLGFSVRLSPHREGSQR